MRTYPRLANILSVVVLALITLACTPEIGSAAWCKMIKEKPKGDLTINEAKDYAKHCVFK